MISGPARQKNCYTNQIKRICSRCDASHAFIVQILIEIFYSCLSFFVDKQLFCHVLLAHAVNNSIGLKKMFFTIIRLREPMASHGSEIFIFNFVGIDF